MVDKSSDATPVDESQSEMRKQKKMLKTVKNTTVLKAVEDIQRMSPEAIRQEFDRLVEHTQRHFVAETNQPCANVAQLLLRCLQNHPQQSCKCFGAMDEYRQCVKDATQRHIERLAEEELQRQGKRPPPPLVVPDDNAAQSNMQPQPTMPQPNMPQSHKPQPNLPLPPYMPEPNVSPTVELGASSLPNSRSWYKPWTWLR